MLTETPLQYQGGRTVAQWFFQWTPIGDHCIVFIFSSPREDRLWNPGAAETTSIGTLLDIF